LRHLTAFGIVYQIVDGKARRQGGFVGGFVTRNRGKNRIG
jgi:hypothetical protein